jgi:hypothetical protein
MYVGFDIYYQGEKDIDSKFAFLCTDGSEILNDTVIRDFIQRRSRLKCCRFLLAFRFFSMTVNTAPRQLDKRRQLAAEVRDGRQGVVFLNKKETKEF